LVNPVDVKVSADGSLYYLDRGASSVYRVQFTGATETVTLTFLTEPAGLDLTLDGLRVITPYSAQSTVGSTRTIGALSSQRVNKTNYRFVNWSDGGAQTHVITTPSGGATYTATYEVKGRR